MSEEERKKDHNNEEINKVGGWNEPVFDGPPPYKRAPREPLPNLNTENAGE